ncbi:MAG: methylenetetrahydrofolate reductase [Candidatus Hodgkinia cicadicola]
MHYCLPLARVEFSLEVFPPKDICKLGLLIREILSLKFQPTFISITCGSNFVTKRISNLIAATFVRHLSMWSLMYHAVSTDIASKEVISILTLSGDK